jgi:hypothetical protein
LNSPNGRLQTVNVVSATDTKSLGLLYYLFYDSIVKVEAKYIIVDVGVPNVSPYQPHPWLVLAWPNQEAVFIYARNVPQFQTTYMVDVLQKVKSMGFNTTTNMPLPAYHGAECNYSSYGQLG